MIRNGNFTEGWRDLPPASGHLINQEPQGWRLEWLLPGHSLFGDAHARAEGIPECVHKLSEQLPPGEQLGQPDALILAGDTTYKLFHASAPFGATLSQTVTGLQPGSEATLTVPIRLHRHGDPDIFGAESGVWVNGQGEWVHGGKMGDRKWYRHRVRFTVPADGRAEVVIRVKSKWPRPKDFFLDGITLEASPEVSEPGPPPVAEPSEPEPEPAPTPTTPTGFRFTHWPTEHRHITQVYNNNPDFYGQWGLTGHEGVDIQAPYESRIFAVAPGTVYLVRAEAEDHAYGNAIYIKHTDGYRTAYAHLKQLHVKVGDVVTGGQLLGLSDGTGNVIPKPTSTAPGLGSHLHLTLYHDGATERGETQQPKDIIDPTPYLDPLLAAGWKEPAQPLISGWGWAPSIERRQRLGRVRNPGGINLRARPDQNASIRGLVNEGTVMRVTGAEQNQYYPLQVSKAALSAQPDEPTISGERYRYDFLEFANSAGDYSNVQAGRQFTATWKVRNSGQEPWSKNSKLVYLQTAVPETENHALSRLGAKAAYTLRQLSDDVPVQPGATITLQLPLVAPQEPGWHASHWQLQTAAGEPIGRPLWLRIQVTGVPVKKVQPKPATRFRPGMNVNPDAHPPDLERLRGLAWVRFVYKAAAKHRSVDEAFHEEYRALIQAYANAGINSLIVLNQETEWGNAPWDNGNWEAYAASLAGAARRVAELCAPFGNSVAYQIWNEEDSPPTNPSAIGVSPENFAPVLAQTAQAIRQVDSDTTVVLGGLNSAPDNAVDYLQRIEARLGGSLPVDAVAYHPYGRYVHTDPFHGKQFGTLQDALRTFRRAYPDLPLWITELGIANDNPIGPEHYPKIANYMREIVTEVAENHGDHVPVLIWFAWSDLMRNAGITTVDGSLKPHIGQAFREMVARGQEQAEPIAADISFGISQVHADAEFLHFTTTLQNHNAVPAGSSFTNQWTFRNSGSTTWGDGYRLVYAPRDGDAHPMMPETEFPLMDVASPLPAEPGQEVTVSLTMTAPEQFGRHHRSRWELRDPQDNAFGHLYAEITTVPASTVGSGVQHADMAFVADHTVDDDTRFLAGESFLKQWRVRNTGARQWGNGFRLVFVEGDLQMARGTASHMVPSNPRGAEVILTIPMTAPPARNNRPTTYQSLWRLQDDRGNFFGTPIWVRIVSLPAQVGTPLGRFSDPANWYSQLDRRWREERLGHGQQTIGAWGCLLTCHAMMLSAFGLPLTPDDLNRRARSLGDDGFLGANIQFAAPSHLLPGVEKMRHLRSWPTPVIPFTEWTGEDPIARIDGALADGYVVLAQVDRGPNNAFYHANTEQHWVILLARTPAGDDYLILDPILPAEQIHTQPTSLMRKYGNPSPSRPHEENLRNAIKSALAYRFVSGAS